MSRAQRSAVRCEFTPVTVSGVDPAKAGKDGTARSRGRRPSGSRAAGRAGSLAQRQARRHGTVRVAVLVPHGGPVEGVQAAAHRTDRASAVARQVVTKGGSAWNTASTAVF
jgi:hypothetical protein